MYAKENFRRVTDMISERRKNAVATSEARNLEAAALSDEIREIDREMRGTGLLLFKAACAGDDITPIRERNLALGELRKRALKKIGLPEDYTDIHYTCALCSDTGYVDTKMCKCMRELLITENIKSSGIGNLMEKQSFDNFSLDHLDRESDDYKQMKRNKKKCREFAENFTTDGKNLLFIGKTGTGKTHLSTAIAKTVVEKGYEVLYDSAQNIVSDFEHDRFKSGYGPYEPKGDKYLECDLLIIDDLGTEFANQFTLSALYNLINTRMNKSLSTVISTNLTAEDLQKKYEDRIYSRLLGGNSQIIMFKGPDMRLKGK